MRTFNWYAAWGIAGYLSLTVFGSTPIFTYWVDVSIVFFCLGYINWRLSKGSI